MNEQEKKNDFSYFIFVFLLSFKKNPIRGSGEFFNACSGNPKVVKAAVCAGLYPNVARVRHPPKVFTQTENGTVAADFKSQEIKLFLRDRSRVFLHPSSLLFHEGR